jgi:hypothetical protein
MFHVEHFFVHGGEKRRRERSGAFDAEEIVKPPESMEMLVRSSSGGKYKVGKLVMITPYGTVYWR